MYGDEDTSNEGGRGEVGLLIAEASSQSSAPPDPVRRGAFSFSLLGALLSATINIIFIDSKMG